MKNYTTIHYETKDGIRTIWLNRPEVHNAFNNTMLTELTDALDKASGNDQIIAVVLRGKGKSFCAGADLNWMRDVANNTYVENYKESLLLSKCFFTLYKCKKPTIAVVHGVSLGGANGFVAACDLAFCDNETTFSLSEVKIGIIPACISPYVVKRVGEYGSKDLMLTGKRIKGKEAENYRLVNKSLETGALETHLGETLGYLKTSGPKAMEHGKSLIFDVANKLTLEEAYDHTARMIADIRLSAEGQEGMAAFLEKRKPNWIKD